MQDYRNLATELVSALKKQGAAADVFITSSTGFNIAVRLGGVLKLQQSKSKGLGLRVFKNGATANTFTTDFSPKALQELTRKTMEIVRISSPDEYNGLPPKELLGIYAGNLPIFDETLAKLPTARKIEIAREAEDSGLKFDKRITNSEGASWVDTQTQTTLANSEGFVGQFQATGINLSVSLIAEQNGDKQTDNWSTISRFLSKLEAPKTVGEEAARRAIGKLGGRRVKSQIAPVIIAPEAGVRFLTYIFRAVSGERIYGRSSFLIDKVGQEVCSPLVTIVDDATMPGGLASYPFDAEGVKASKTTIIEKGVLRKYLTDTYAARRLNTVPTGNAWRTFQSNPGVRASNFYVENGTATPESIIKSVKNGFYLRDIFGTGINNVTGNFSQGASGFWIENGEITHPVREITLAGNALKVFKDVRMIGNDLSFRFGNIATPTLLITEMTVGGE